MKPVLEFEKICKSFVGTKALSDVSFSVYPGEVHVLIGENGAGKSTLLKILSGLYNRDSGTIIYNGAPVEFKNPEEAKKAGIAMVYQELTIFPYLTVLDNVFFNYADERKMKLDRKGYLKRYNELADQYGISLDPYVMAGELPIAKQQLVEIMRVLISDPEVIIFDEPTAVLSKNEVLILTKIIDHMIKQNKSVIFISHRMEEIFEIGDKVTVLKNGHHIITIEIEKTNTAEIVKYMTGKSLENVFPPKNKISSKEIIFEAKDLSVGKKVQNVSFQIRRGDILGIAGLEGHGQNELMRALAGVDKISGGEIVFNGERLKLSTPRKAIAKKIGYVPEDRKNQALFLNQTVQFNVSIESLSKRLKGIFLDLKKEQQFVKESIERYEVAVPSILQNVVRLSGGNQQKCVISKVMAIDPKVLLYNEPTRGIDVKTKQDIYHMMRKQADDGMVIIMYSSDMMELIGMCDQVIILYDGKVNGILEKEEIQEKNIMHYAVGLS